MLAESGGNSHRTRMLDLVAPMRLSLLLPGLLWPEVGSRLFQDQRIPALEILLAKASRDSNGSQSMESSLRAQFGITTPAPLPYAALAVLAGNRWETGRHYAFADPVHLAVDRDRLVMADGMAFNVTEVESEALMQTLNGLFSDDGLHFVALDPRHWIIERDRAIDVAAVPIHEARGKAVDSLLPSGADQQNWRATQSEIQMLLHDHPVNEARENRGELPINSVWFWGGGVLPPLSKSVEDKSKTLCADLAWVRGFARHLGVPAASIAEWEKFLQAPELGTQCLVADDSLQARIDYSDMDGWRTALTQLEASLFAPALGHLQRGALEEISIQSPTANDSKIWTVARGDLRKFWRRPKPLATLLAP